MRGINKVILVGTLGKDPESRDVNGSTVCNFSMATNEKWKDKNTGEQKESTEWHRITIWGRLAEIAVEYLHKGSQVYIEGKLQTRKWQDKDGQDRYTTEIVGSELQMLGGKGGDRSQNSHQSAPDSRQQAPAQQSMPDDDVPF